MIVAGATNSGRAVRGRVVSAMHGGRWPPRVESASVSKEQSLQRAPGSLDAHARPRPPAGGERGAAAQTPRFRHRKHQPGRGTQGAQPVSAGGKIHATFAP